MSAAGFSIASSSLVAAAGGNTWKKRKKSYSDFDRKFARDAFDALISEDFFLFPSMIRGRIRVERLLSKATELEFGDQLIVQLTKLGDMFADLFESVTELEPKLPENDDLVNRERIRLVQLAKQILIDWEAIENAIPQPDHRCSVYWLSMDPFDYPPAVPSAWLFEYDWRDKAYAEVLSMRKKYSYFLDEAYRLSHTLYLKGVSGGPIVSARKKLLHFVVISREDLHYMHVEKCLQRVTSIKQLSIQMNQPSQRAAGNETQLPNWRDEIYEQVAAYRKMYSLRLDELLRDEVEKMQVSDAVSSRKTFLEESLQFLANYRSGITFLLEEDCRKQLAEIKHFMEEVSLPEKQQTTPPPQSHGQASDADCLMNWRDLEYEGLQDKAHRFMYEVYGVYLKYKPLWSKIAACDEDLKKLESHLKRAMEFYKMTRGKMSLLFKTKKDYYDECGGKLKEDVEASIALIKLLLCSLEEGTKPTWDCLRPHKLIPSWVKFYRPLNGLVVP